MGHAPLQLEEKVFGRLKVLRRVFPNRYSCSVWECLCDCGTITNTVGNTLTRKKHPVKSCGCITVDSIRAIAIRHGKSGTVEYKTLKGMVQRCYNKNSKEYPDYGGRGIEISARWRGDNGFQNFLHDMGLRPEGFSIERKDVNGNYEPSNCVWASDEDQHKNRRKFVALSNYTNDELIQEYERRFPLPEYGATPCFC